jgi:hypothetical protein
MENTENNIREQYVNKKTFRRFEKKHGKMANE